MFFGSDVKATSRLTFSGLYLRTTPQSFEYKSDNISALMLAEQNSSSLVKLGTSYRFAPGVSASVSYGLLQQQDETLGMRTAGAFSLGNSVTHLAGGSISADVAPKTTITAYAEHSTTDAYDGHNSLFASDAWSGSKYGLSLTQTGAFGLGGALRLTLSRPWQIDSGTLNAHVPVGRELDGTIDFADRAISVAQGGTPIELGMAYLWGANRLKYGAEMRMLDHDIGAQNFSEYSVAAALHWSF
jgi:hypothetical protein